MNEVLKAIRNRRSTRLFTDDQVKREDIEKILDAAIYSPSAHNDQPWRFTVIQNKELLQEFNMDCKIGAKDIEDDLLRKMANNEKLNLFYNAPTVILVCGEEKAIMPQVDCAAATENMLIAAESLGLGSCWIGFAAFAFIGEKDEYYRKKFEIPEGYKPYYAVSLGHKRRSQQQKAPKRRENTINYIL